MHPESHDLSTAVVLFLGFGLAPCPRADRIRLLDEFGAETGAEAEYATEEEACEYLYETLKVDPTTRRR